MYLNNIIIENMGAIERLELLKDDLIKASGDPRVVILVGQNGSGKTTLLSSIVDAFHELANKCFDDVLQQTPKGHQYFKISGGVNLRVNCKYGFSYLNFSKDTKNYEYIDKNGELSVLDCKNKTNELLLLSINKGVKENFKLTSDVKDQEEFLEDFSKNSYCYFPSDRFESPYWLNESSSINTEQFFDSQVFSNRLNKKIIIRRSLSEIKSWLLDVFLDSRADILVSKNEVGETSYNSKQNLETIEHLQKSLSNMEKVISLIVGADVLLEINYRVSTTSRLKLVDAKTRFDILPSLNNLSAGQSTLLSIFANIVKSSDRYDLNKSINISDISGIVLIDEIDLHLHIDLQKDILPKLIKMFPKVQFIVTSHSPFFLNGMAKAFNQDDYVIVNMPTGNKLNAYDEFEEFNKAYEVFEDLIGGYRKERDNLALKIKDLTKPIIITEGKTDKVILETAWSKLYKEEMPFIIIPSGVEENEAVRTGNADQVKRTLELMSNITQNTVIGLFDNDKEGAEQLKGINQKIFNKFDNNINYRKHKSKEIYGLLLTVPEQRKKFIDCNDITQRYFVIEHYFSDNILNINNMKGSNILGTNVFKIQGDKEKFSKTIASLKPPSFSKFKVLFDQINQLLKIKLTETNTI